MQDKRRATPEEGGREDMNLTNNDASLERRTSVPPDAPVMSDRAGDAANENMTQTALEDGEVAHEFGDAADPAFEELGQHHRDE